MRGGRVNLGEGDPGPLALCVGVSLMAAASRCARCVPRLLRENLEAVLGQALPSRAESTAAEDVSADCAICYAYRLPPPEGGEGQGRLLPGWRTAARSLSQTSQEKQ